MCLIAEDGAMRLSLVGVSESQRAIAGRSYLIGGYGNDWIDQRARGGVLTFLRVCNILTCMLFMPHDSL